MANYLKVPDVGCEKKRGRKRPPESTPASPAGAWVQPARASPAAPRRAAISPRMLGSSMVDGGA